MAPLKLACSFVLAFLVPIYISAQGLLLLRKLLDIKYYLILMTDKL